MPDFLLAKVICTKLNVTGNKHLVLDVAIEFRPAVCSHRVFQPNISSAMHCIAIQKLNYGARRTFPAVGSAPP